MDLIGKKFGNLLVMGYGKKVGRKQYYICRCDCGNEKEIRSDSLMSGSTTSCGCANKSKNNIIGKKFGRLTVIAEGKTYKKLDGQAVGKYYTCKCECGVEKDVLRTNLINGKTQSCGCWHAEELSKINPERFGVIDNTNVNIIKNTNLTRANTSGIKGVSWHKGRQKWVARITFKGKSYWLGAYYTKEEAAQIRKIAEEKMFGDFLLWFAESFPERWNKINKNN